MEPPYSLEAAARRIGNNDEETYLIDDASGEVFQARFVIQDHIGIPAYHRVQNSLQDVIGIAVTARPLGAPHGNEIEIITLHQTLGDTEFQKTLFVHAPDRPLLGEFPGVLADTAHSLNHINTQGCVKAGIGIGIYGQHRFASPLKQAHYQERRHGRLSDTAFTCYCDQSAHNGASRFFRISSKQRSKSSGRPSSTERPSRSARRNSSL